MNNKIRRLVHRIPCCFYNLPISYFCKVGISLLLNNMRTVLKDSRDLSSQKHYLLVIEINIVTF